MTFILCHEYFFSSYLLLPPILIHLRHKTQICYKKKINNIKMAVRFIIDFAVVLNNVNAFFSDFLFINFPRRIREIVARSEHNLSKGGRVARERDCSGQNREGEEEGGRGVKREGVGEGKKEGKMAHAFKILSARVEYYTEGIVCYVAFMVYVTKWKLPFRTRGLKYLKVVERGSRLLEKKKFYVLNFILYL